MIYEELSSVVNVDSSADKRSAHGERTEAVYLTLRDLIIRGRLPPGAKAVELKLAEQLGVSRTPIRESLARLEREGFLVPSTRGRRTELQVAALSADDVAELWDVIGALEALAISGVGQLGEGQRSRLTDALQTANEELRAATSARPRDRDLVFELQTKFHICFMDVCAGPRLRMLYDAVRPHVQRYEWAYGMRSDAPYEQSLADHEEITAAVSRGDSALAHRLITAHWHDAVRRTSKLVEPQSS